jgi:hypothetical protein
MFKALYKPIRIAKSTKLIMLFKKIDAKLVQKKNTEKISKKLRLAMRVMYFRAVKQVANVKPKNAMLVIDYINKFNFAKEASKLANLNKEEKNFKKAISKENNIFNELIELAKEKLVYYDAQIDLAERKKNPQSAKSIQKANHRLHILNLRKADIIAAIKGVEEAKLKKVIAEKLAEKQAKADDKKQAKVLEEKLKAEQEDPEEQNALEELAKALNIEIEEELDDSPWEE